MNERMSDERLEDIRRRIAGPDVLCLEPTAEFADELLAEVDRLRAQYLEGEDKFATAWHRCVDAEIEVERLRRLLGLVYGRCLGGAVPCARHPNHDEIEAALKKGQQ